MLENSNPDAREHNPSKNTIAENLKLRNIAENKMMHKTSHQQAFPCWTECPGNQLRHPPRIYPSKRPSELVPRVTVANTLLRMCCRHDNAVPIATAKGMLVTRTVCGPRANDHHSTSNNQPQKGSTWVRGVVGFRTDAWTPGGCRDRLHCFFAM